jgi:hypothetical protein
MNPIYAKTPTDRDKYRQNYLANLAVEHSNNTLNLNANQQFKATGQTPTQPTDTRTITEKYQDIDRLKTELRSGLMGLTDGTNANQIVEDLTPAELMFATTQFPFIVQDLKPKWKLGIPAPIFLAYLRRLIAKWDQTEGVELGLQQATGEAILLGQQQILGNMVNQDDLRALNTAIRMVPINIASSASVRNLLREVMEDIRDMEGAIPNAQDFAGMDRLPYATRADIQVLLNEALRDFPTRDMLRQELDELYQATQMGDERRLEQVLRAIRGDLDIDPASRDQLERVRQEILEAIAGAVRELPAGGGREAIIEAHPVNQEAGNHEGGRPPPRDRPVMGIQVVGDRINSEEDFNALSLKDKRSFLTQTGLSTGVRHNGNSVYNTSIREGANPATGVYWRDTNIPQLVGLWVAEKNRIGRVPNKYKADTGDFSGEGLMRGKMRGKGLVKKQSHSIAHKIEAPIVKPKMYAPFGSVAINKHKLADGILMLRNPSGGALADLPSHRISEKLAKVFKSIVGGSNPSFEDIAELAEHDKDHLHKVLHRTKQLDRIAVPKPKVRSENEKELNRFEILRGEIMAGNDNKHLVREFKVLLIKLMNRGLVPKRQAHDILIDITSMGL